MKEAKIEVNKAHIQTTLTSYTETLQHLHSYAEKLNDEEEIRTAEEESNVSVRTLLSLHHDFYCTLLNDIIKAKQKADKEKVHYYIYKNGLNGRTMHYNYINLLP